MEITVVNSDRLVHRLEQIQEIGKPEYMNNLGIILATYIQDYVPEGETGNLRKAYDMLVTKNHVSVTWDGPKGQNLPYTHYQYEGRIYSPNIAQFTGNTHTGWISLKGKTKFPKTTAPINMGVKRDITLKDGRVIHIKGYTTPGTGPKWIEKFVNGNTYVEAKIVIGRYLYEAYCHEVGIKPVGGFVQFMQKLPTK